LLSTTASLKYPKNLNTYYNFKKNKKQRFKSLGRAPGLILARVSTYLLIKLYEVRLEQLWEAIASEMVLIHSLAVALVFLGLALGDLRDGGGLPRDLIEGHRHILSVSNLF
jgi:hypothetical protein